MTCNSVFSVKQGDSLTWDCKWWSDSSETTPLDLTGYTLRASADHPDGAHIVFVVTVVDATQGKFTLYIPPAVTKTMATGMWAADIRREQGPNVKKSTTTFHFVVEDSIVEP